ncbi:dihydrolipoamide acetyltransferase family protein [Arthrobacter sp. YD2]|uniref:dihydrolipoamide acetyltransferase family protein n=1 Tax=Arthrobacter sp. YD2 TaxID=3058046 RepID=UPI0025B4B77B|nr:dihydrolipoamide acetyltransferase family protein [Arthrobacter sp. YD2]MDN3903643.1 dihydrolipoamide acetyltransferase family protein [Arthrobacter sp. YD2]
MRTFLLPDLGEGLTEAELVSWLVAVGDSVAVDQPVAEVETAKSLVEVPSPYAGRVAQLHGNAGESMDVGRPLISVDTAPADTAPADTAPADTAPGGAAPAAGLETAAAVGTVEAAVSSAGEAYRQEEKAGSGNVLIGYGTPEAAKTARRTRPPKSPPRPALQMNPPQSAAPRCISPLVRRMARESGLRLADLSGSGPDGLILRRDVQAALRTVPVQGESSFRTPAGVSTTALVGAVSGPADTTASGPVDTTASAAGTKVSGPDGSAAPLDPRTGLQVVARTPVRGVRRTVAANLTRSRALIPEATVWVDVDATALMELRSDLGRGGGEVPSLLAFLARFTLAGLRRFPELNTRYVPGGTGTDGLSADAPDAAIEAFEGINLGIAVQAGRGLMVPAVRRADSLSTRDLDTEIRRLTAAAQAGRATAAELTSGTFTLNNYGVFGVDGSAAIINYPESAILGVGRIIDKPWVVRGELAVRKMTELTLVFDHRVCDGGTAGGFLRYVADAVENPGRVLADL